MSAQIQQSSSLGVFGTLREGIRISPAIKDGIVVSALLAIVATIGKVVVPMTVQLTTDRGLFADGGVDVPLVIRLCALAAGLLLLTSACTTWVNIRLFRAAEAGLAQLRVKAFRHVHDLSVLTQNTERRGSLVSRVTSDVDTVSMFVQWGGMMLLLSSLQIVAATAAMLVYSWQLTLVVWAAFAPMLVLAPRAQRGLSRAYGAVRERVGIMLGRISESVVGAQTIRAYGAEERTQRRMDAAIEDHRRAAVRAQTFAAAAFSTGVLLSGVALSAVVVVGTMLGLAGEITVGGLLAFLFLVQLFVGPVQSATEVLNEMQNAVAGWRRVITVLHTPRDVTDPERPVPAGPRGPAELDFQDVSFAYPGTQRVLSDVTLTIPAGARVAIVGETGSGKTTLAKLLTRMMDPVSGSVRLNGTDLRDLTLAELRERVVMVPQEGFLFDGTIAENIAYGRGSGIGPAEVEEVLHTLGLDDWVATLPGGVRTDVGQRGEALSAGERQLVAIARAYLADADVLVLDEATSAVDPATEQRISTALARLTQGRTSVAIAHRLSTAEAAELVVVVDAGRVVEAGSHAELLAAEGVYARMYASWIVSSA